MNGEEKLIILQLTITIIHICWLLLLNFLNLNILDDNQCNLNVNALTTISRKVVQKRVKMINVIDAISTGKTLILITLIIHNN